ncbi:hypothetical protein [Hyphomonas jannaschiana]|uniref:hypothetical protein n=1 Tax=Hyphomonas jannaschiana TaxID=86 RepID=UPI0035C75903
MERISSQKPVNLVDDTRCAELKDFALVRCILENARIDHQNDIEIENLKVQQDIALSAFVSTLLAACAAIASSVSIMLTVWTVRETRLLSQNQSQAFVDIAKFEFRHHPTWGTVIWIGLKNSGLTPARNVKITGEFKYQPEQNEGKALGSSKKEDFSGTLEQISAHEYDVCELNGYADFPYDQLQRAAIGDKPFVGTEDCIPATIRFVGVLTYNDVYGRHHSRNIYLSTTRLGDNQPYSIFGAGKHWRAEEMFKDS